MTTSRDHATTAIAPRRSVSHGDTLLLQRNDHSPRTPPRLPPRRRSSFGQVTPTPPPLPARPRTLYPSSAGPRLPSTFAQDRQAAAARARQHTQQHRNGVPPPSAYKPPAAMSTDEDDKPVDIRARVAAFENFNSSGGPSRGSADPKPVPAKRVSPVPPPPPPRYGSPALAHEISRVSSTPRSRPGDEPSPVSAPEPDPLAEFGALSPQMRFGGSARSAAAGQPAFRTTTGHATPPSAHLPPSASASLPISSSSTGLYSASPHGSASLSPVSAHRVPAPVHHHASSPTSAFDLYASSVGGVRRQASGTSLRDLTNASLARAAHQYSSRQSSPGMASDQFPGSVSGKVPLPNMGPSSLSRRGSPSPHRMASSPTTGRESPAPPPPPRNLTSSLYARSSASSPQLVPGQTPVRHAHHRSSVSSSSSSAASASRSHLLEDDEDGGGDHAGYGLSLHPALQPTASPVSSRAPSRASMSRSAPASPKGPPPTQLPPSDTSQAGLAAPSAHVRLHPPTPSPERRPVDAIGVSPSHTGHRTRSMDSSSSQEQHNHQVMSTSPTVNYAIRKKGPALPPRGGMSSSEASSDVAASPPVSYTPYNPARRASGGSVGVASKVPLPPKFPSSGSNTLSSSPSLQRSTPAPAPLIPPRPAGVRIRHTSSHSTGSSPAQSPLPSPGHRVTKSGPGPAGLSDWPSTTGGGGIGQTLQPPPTRTAMTRTRSSSMGPSGSGALPTRKTGANVKAPANVFHGSRAYQTAALARSSPPSTMRSRASSGRVAADPKPTPPTSQSVEPRDEGARKRYEAVWERETGKRRKTARGRKASAGRGGVASLAQQFEGMRGTDDGASASSTAHTRLSPHQVSRIWTRSHLRADVLSRIWEAAVDYERRHPASQATGRGLGKESFVRSLAAIDAELEYRSEKRKWKERRRSRAKAAGNAGGTRHVSAEVAVDRRLPPPV